MQQRWIRGHKARGQGYKKIRGKTQGPTFRGCPLEAKDQGHNAQMFFIKKGLRQKKSQIFAEKGLRPKNCKFSRKFRLFPKKVFINFPRGFWRAPRRKTKMVITLAIFKKSKNSVVLEPIEDRAFSSS